MPNRVRGDQVLGVPALAPVLEHLERLTVQEIERRAVAIAASALISLEGARDQLATYQRAGVDLDLAERAIRAGLPPHTVIDVLRSMEEVQTVKQPELPPLTVEAIQARAACTAEREERRGKWRGQGHAGQTEKARQKRRRKAKMARASRRRR